MMLLLLGFAVGIVLADDASMPPAVITAPRGERACTYNRSEPGGISWYGWWSQSIDLDEDCTEIDLATWSFHFGNTGATALARALESAPNIEKLRLAYNRISSSGIVALSEVFDGLPRLAHLDLEGNDCSGGNGSAGYIALVSALESRSMLRSLNLSSTGLNDESLQMLTKSLVKMPRLGMLNLNSNSISDSGASILADASSEMPKLDSLYLAKNAITEKGVKYIAEALAKKQGLVRLDLSAFGRGEEHHDPSDAEHLGVDGSMALMRSLKASPDFEELYLNGRGIGNDGLVFLTRGFQRTPKLTSLELQANAINDHGAELIAEAMKGTPHLVRLDLSMNRIGDKGAVAIAAAMPHVQLLQELQLRGRGNQFGKQGLTALAKGLAKTSDLRELSVHSIGSGGHLEELAAGLASTPRLERLSLWSDSVTLSGAEAIAIAAADLPALRVVELHNMTLEKRISWAFADLMLNRIGGGDKDFRVMGLDGEIFENVLEAAHSALGEAVARVCGASIAAAGAQKFLSKALAAVGAKDDRSLQGRSDDEINTDLKDAGIPIAPRNALRECFVKIGEETTRRLGVASEL